MRNLPSGRETAQYQSIFSRLDLIINHLSDSVAVESLADKLYRKLVITRDSYGAVCVAGVPNHLRVRTLIRAVLSKIELNVTNFDKFIATLREFQGLDDIIDLINVDTR